MKHLFSLVIVLGIISTVESSTLRVPSQYPRIQAAIGAASDGDTVLVAPGTYSDNLNFLGKRIVVVSSGGATTTTITAYSLTSPVVQMTNHEPKGTVLQGFTITGSTFGGIWCTYSSPTILDNIIVGNRSEINNTSPGISLKNTTGSFVSRNVIASNAALAYGGGIHVGDDNLVNQYDTICYNILYGNTGGGAIRALGKVTGLSIYNNTIASADAYGILLNNTGSVDIRNNIISGVKTYYAVGEAYFFCTAVCSYNCLFGNTGLGNFNQVTEGPGNITADPSFLDAIHHDYRLLFGSPCIDTGDPAAAYNDPNGSRNDIGARPYSAPYILGLNLGSESLLHVETHTPTFYWNYFDPQSPQTAFEIEVGSQASWPIADMWQSGVVNASDTFVTFAGTPLVDGTVYFVRLRVGNEHGWSAWSQVMFHVYPIPSPPLLIYPIAGENAPAAGITLLVQSNTDTFRDSVRYDFEIYQDENLATKVDSLFGVSQQPDSTFATGFGPLNLLSMYWWRVRAFDGIEKSNWSSPASFVTRPPTTIHVPADQGSIRAGVMHGGVDDTVLVSPGTYSEFLVFPRRNMVVRSTNGPLQTTISPDPNNDIITFTGGVDSRTVIEGFTLRGGRMAIWCQNSAPTIRHNILISQGIYNWSAIALSGAGWGIDGPSPATIVNNTIIGSHNGGISSFSTEAPIIRDNIIAFNSNYGVHLQSAGHPYSTSYNAVFGNPFNYINLGPGTGSITVDPQLNADHTLGLTSPCIDAGDPSADYNDPDGSRNDLGAVPLTSCCLAGQMRGDITGNLVVDLADLSFLVGYLAAANMQVPCLLAGNIDNRGIVDLGDLSLLTRYLTGSSGTITLMPCSAVAP